MGGCSPGFCFLCGRLDCGFEEAIGTAYWFDALPAKLCPLTGREEIATSKQKIVCQFTGFFIPFPKNRSTLELCVNTTLPDRVRDPVDGQHVSRDPIIYAMCFRITHDVVE